MAFRPATLLKRDSDIGFSYEICKVYKNTYFTEHRRWLLLAWFSNLWYGETLFVSWFYSFQFKLYMILTNFVKVNYLIYCVQEKTPKIKRLIQYVK